MPDAFRAEVFELFNRGDEMLSSERGTGIGLAIVARFAALHGGKAWVESTRSGGEDCERHAVAISRPSTSSKKARAKGESAVRART